MSIDKNKVHEFWKSRTEIQDSVLATHFKNDGTQAYDLRFILDQVDKPCKTLDLGAGTCMVSAELAKQGYKVTAVDKYKEFLDKAPQHENLQTIVADVETFETTDRFDMILVFGVTNYFSNAEAEQIYINCKKHLTPNGVLLVKHQYGIEEDVVVDHYSEQIGSDYHAVYRRAEMEHSLLSSIFANILQHDIYPDNLNKWDNTRFYSFVCKNNKESTID